MSPPASHLEGFADTFLTVFGFFLLIRGQIKLADFGLARLYNSEER